MGERVRSCPFAILREGGDKANQDVRARHECQAETSQASRFVSSLVRAKILSKFDLLARRTLRFLCEGCPSQNDR
jgi:hypothetical protein